MENTKITNTCRNCHYLIHPNNYPAALHRVYDCFKRKWNNVTKGINPNNPNGVRSPNLDHSCNEFKPDIRNHSIPDREKKDVENRLRAFERDEWERSMCSDYYAKRRLRRTRRKHSIEHLRGEPSFATSDNDSGDSSRRYLKAFEALLPSGSIRLGIFKEEPWNFTKWRTEIWFYLVKSEDPNFLWDLCGINWGKYKWELYSRITNIKDPEMAGFLLIENLFDSWDKNTRANPYRDFLTSILNDYYNAHFKIITKKICF
jgi:hypothetical protein